MPRRGFGSAPCAMKHAALCISKKNTQKNTKITHLPLPSACLPIFGALNELFGCSGPVFFISRSCSPPAGAAGKLWKRVAMQERQRPAGRKDHRSRGGIFLACLCACSPASLRELQSHQHIPAPSGAGTDTPGASPRQGLGFWEAQWGHRADPITASALRDVRGSTAAWG